MILIGLMSGTSADGIDAAVVDIRGQGRRTRIQVLGSITIPFSSQVRDSVLRASDPLTSSMPDVCRLSFRLGELFSEASRVAAEEAGINLDKVSAIASHGQTIWHLPDPPSPGDIPTTFQIGEPAIIAARTGCRVVSGFRVADMAAGGQGAPLVPYFDWAVLTSNHQSRAVLNIGGIANVTYLPCAAELDDVRAFDTGPGNMVIDRLAWQLSGGQLNMDAGGDRSARGEVDRRVLGYLLRQPFLKARPPKSAGRIEFGTYYADELWRKQKKKGMRAEDLMATVTALTAESINRAFRQWLGPVEEVIVGGGGARNRTLMGMLDLGGARIASHEEFGIPDDGKEAVAFALLGYETLHGRPSNVPSATGASRSVVLGSITPSP